MIEIEKDATLLSADSKEYNIEGNSGVSHKARFLIDSEIYALRATEDLVEALKACIKDGRTEGKVTIAFTSQKENLKAELVSYE